MGSPEQMLPDITYSWEHSHRGPPAVLLSFPCLWPLPPASANAARFGSIQHIIRSPYFPRPQPRYTDVDVDGTAALACQSQAAVGQLSAHGNRIWARGEIQE